MRVLTIHCGAALVAFLAALATTRTVAQDAIAPFVVAVWGQHDALIPFADFDGERWRSSWPAPRNLEAPARPLERIPTAWWGASPPTATWELVEPNGRRRALRVTGTRRSSLGSGCSQNLGLTTDAPAKTYQYGRVLAASRPGIVEPVEALTASTREWRTVSALLPGLYRQHEPRAWRERLDEFRLELKEPRSQPVLRAAYVAADDAGQFAYFKSSRVSARRRSELTIIAGWLWRRSPASPFQVVTVTAEVNSIDEGGEAGMRFTPLGIVRHGSRQFWLGYLSSYLYGGVTVIDVRRAGVNELLRIDYPGC